MPKRIHTGRYYKTVTGLPVRVVSITSGHILLESLSTNNRFFVAVNHPLKSYKGVQTTQPGSNTCPVPKPPRQKHLSAIIDACLLAGGKTMRGIAREVKRKASVACRGKNVPANIRARIHWFKKKGYKVK